MNFSKSPYLKNFFNIFYIQLFLSLLISLGITFYYYREKEHKKSIQRVLKQNRAIINSASNMVIVSEDEYIIDCNKAFLNFFEISSLDEYPNRESFSKEFIDYDDYFYCKTHQGWIEKILQLSPEERIVSMLDDYLVGRAFKVSVQLLEDEHRQYVVILSDITKERIKEKKLEKKHFLIS